MDKDPVKLEIIAERFRQYLACAVSYGSDAVMALDALRNAGAESGSVRSVCEYVRDGCKFEVQEKKRPLRGMDSGINSTEFMAISDLLWRVASDDGVGMTLNISGTRNTEGALVIALSLCSQREAE